MKRLLTSALALIGIPSSAASDQKAESLDAKSILFSVPTISNDLAPLTRFEGALQDAVVSFHEDEWSQIEFFSRTQLPALKQMMSEYKSFEAANRANHGWRNVYVRKVARTPVLSGPRSLKKLETILGAKAGPPPVLFSASSITGQVTDGFSVPLAGSITLYGYSNQAGIPILGALVGENPDHQVLVKAFANLSAEEGLVLADWRQQLILVSVASSGQLDAWRP